MLLISLVAIFDPIVYDYNGQDEYLNQRLTGSKGIEASFRWRHRIIKFNSSYSFYVRDPVTVPEYAVPQDASVHLGLPAHKIAVDAAISLGSDMHLLSSCAYFSRRYGYVFQSGEMAVSPLPSVVLLNILLERKNIFTAHLDAQVGVMNILNDNYLFVQPYNGGHTPLPGASRELVARLSYSMSL